MARRKKFKVWWAFGAIALAIGILILGRLSSENITEKDPRLENVQVQNIELNTNQADSEIE